MNQSATDFSLGFGFGQKSGFSQQRSFNYQKSPFNVNPKSSIPFKDVPFIKNSLNKFSISFSNDVVIQELNFKQTWFVPLIIKYSNIQLISYLQEEIQAEDREKSRNVQSLRRRLRSPLATNLALPRTRLRAVSALAREL